tara:strand:+ start:5299 stop:5511 length:213 start_codon:yes stop_codon:yes gene_type:complete
VTAVRFPELFFDVERLKAALNVVVPDYVMRATDYATSAACAEPGSDYLFVKFFPLKGPTFRFGCFGAFLS